MYDQPNNLCRSSQGYTLCFLVLNTSSARSLAVTLLASHRASSACLPLFRHGLSIWKFNRVYYTCELGPQPLAASLLEKHFGGTWTRYAHQPEYRSWDAGWMTIQSKVDLVRHEKVRDGASYFQAWRGDVRLMYDASGDYSRFGLFCTKRNQKTKVSNLMQNSHLKIIQGGCSLKW